MTRNQRAQTQTKEDAQREKLSALLVQAAEIVVARMTADAHVGPLDSAKALERLCSAHALVNGDAYDIDEEDDDA